MEEDLRARSAEEVLEDHLRLADLHRFDEDIERNVAPHCTIFERRGIFHGREGARELARLLEDELPGGAPYTYRTRQVEGTVAFLEWTAEAEGARVRDGADSFVIEDGWIVAQTIHYTVEQIRARAGRRAAQLMAEAFDAVATQDLDRLQAVWDARSTDVFHALDLQVTGRADLCAFFAELFAAITDMRFEVEDVHDVDASTAVGQWHLTGRFAGGPFQGIEPTGRPIELRGVDVMRFDGDVLRRNDVYYDGLSFARQIGMLPAAGGVGDHAITVAFNAATRARTAIAQRRR